MKVLVLKEAFDPYQKLAEYQRLNLPTGKVGGVVSFVGAMRDYNDGHEVSAMRLDHYPGMTERHIERVCTEAEEKWGISDSYVVHRYGTILPDEAIVLVAVWAPHRADAFDACRYIINFLKERAPFWKCETTTDGNDRWVEHNTKDPAAEVLKQRA